MPDDKKFLNRDSFANVGAEFWVPNRLCIVKTCYLLCNQLPFFSRPIFLSVFPRRSHYLALAAAELTRIRLDAATGFFIRVPSCHCYYMM